jgi:hypothetical protein
MRGEGGSSSSKQEHNVSQLDYWAAAARPVTAASDRGEPVAWATWSPGALEKQQAETSSSDSSSTPGHRVEAGDAC